MAIATNYSGAQTDLGALMDRVSKKREEAIITRKKGEPVVMLSLDEWSRINETLHIMSSQENIDALRDSIDRLENRKGIRKSRKKIDEVKSNSSAGMTNKSASKTFRLRNMKRNKRNGRELPRQAEIILKTMRNLGGVATKLQIVNGLESNGLETCQEPKRIFDYYRKRLVDDGYLQEIDPASGAP